MDDLNTTDQNPDPGPPKKPTKERLAALEMRRRSRILAGAPQALGVAPPPPLPAPTPVPEQPVAQPEATRVATPTQLQVMRGIAPLPIAEAPRQAPTPLEPPATVEQAPPPPTTIDRLRALPIVGSHLASIGERVAGTVLKAPAAIAPQSTLAQRLSDAGARLQEEGTAHQAQEQAGRADWPAAARIPADMLDLYSELEIGGRIPGLGRVLGAEGPSLTVRAERDVSGQIVGALERTRGAVDWPGRILARTGTEAARFGTLEGAKAAAQGESPTDIAQQTVAGATGGAAFGAGFGAVGELWGAGLRGAILARARANLPPLEVPTMTEPRFPAAAEQRLLRGPEEPTPSVMPQHVQAQGARQVLEMMQPQLAPAPAAAAAPRALLPSVAEAAQEKELRETPAPERSYAAAHPTPPEAPSFEEFIRGKGGAAAEYRDELRRREAQDRVLIEAPRTPYGENVTAPAVRVGKQVFTGHNHGDALEAAQRALGREVGWNDIEAGFATSERDFVDRLEANRIALQSRQITPAEAKAAGAYLRAETLEPRPTMVQEIPSYHGTPHRFEQFEQHRIGTGQGAASFGHGFYFAENPAVARTYRPQRTSEAGDVIFNGERLPDDLEHPTYGTSEGEVKNRHTTGASNTYDFLRKHGVQPNDMNTLVEAFSRVGDVGGVDEARASLQRLITSHEENLAASRARGSESTVIAKERDRLLRMARRELAVLDRYGDRIKFDRPGAVYNVRLNVEPPELLDWDKSAAEQPPIVQQAFARLGMPGGGTFEIHQAGGGYAVYYRQPTGGLLSDKKGEPVNWGNFRAMHMAEARAAELNRNWSKSAEGSYRLLAERLGGQERASAALRKFGVKGIRYLDQGSRNPTYRIEVSEPGQAPHFKGEGYETVAEAEEALQFLRQTWARSADQQAVLNQARIVRSPQTYNYVIFDAQDIGRPVRVEEGEAGAYPERQAEIVFPAESVSSGLFGFVPKLAGAPDAVLKELSDTLDRELGPQETALAGDLVGHAWPTTEQRGFGMWRGQINPNVVTRIPTEAGPEYAGTLAAVRGLLRGQDFQLWWRRLRDAEPGGEVGFVVSSRGRPLTEADYRQLEQIIARDPKLAALDGSTFAADHILFLNGAGLPVDEWQELLEEAIKQLPEELDLDSRSYRFQVGRYDGPRAFLKGIGRRPDALRRVADLFTRVSRPVYERAAAAVGEAPAAAAERLDAHAAFLRAAAEAAAETTNDIQRVFAELKPATPRVTLEVAGILAKRGRPSLELATDDEKLARLIERGFADLRDAIRLFHSAGAWYDLDMARAHALALAELPRTRELAYRTIFDAVVAVLSNGNQIRPNWESAIAVMRNFDRGGHLSLYAPGTATETVSTKLVRTTIQGKARRIKVARKKITGTYAEGVRGHERQQIHETGLAKLDALVQQHGLEGAAHELLQLVPKGPRTPEAFPAFYHLVGTDPIKIASFFANLVGLHDFVTVDQWMQKWFYAALGFVRRAPVRVFEKGRWITKAGEWRIDDSPKASEARIMRQAIRQLALKANTSRLFAGQQFTPASVQALLWYLMKYRYAKFGAGETEAISFSQAQADLLFGRALPEPERRVIAQDLAASALWGDGGELLDGRVVAGASRQLELQLDVPEATQAFGSEQARDEAVDHVQKIWDYFERRSKLSRQIVAELKANRAVTWLGKEIPTAADLRAGPEDTEADRFTPTEAAEHVAAMLQTIRSPFVETIALLGMKQGKVVVAHFVSSGAPDFVLLGTGGVGMSSFRNFLEECNGADVDTTMSAHNHPSGQPEPSGWQGDRTAFRNFAGMAEDEFGIRHMGDIVVDDDMFTLTTLGGHKTTFHAYTSTGKANWLGLHPFAGPQYVVGPQDIASFVHTHTRAEGIYAMYIRAGGAVVSLEAFPPETSLLALTDRLEEAMPTYGASRVIIGVPKYNPSDRPGYRELVRHWDASPSFGRMVADVVTWDEDTIGRLRNVVSALAQGHIDGALYDQRRNDHIAQMTSVRVDDSATSLDPWDGQPGYVDPIEQGSRPQQTPLGGPEAGIPQVWRDITGPIVGEDGLPRLTGIILQDSLDGSSPYGVTPQAETAIGKLVKAFAGTRLEQIGPQLHYLLVEYERQRATLAREVHSDVVQESLDRAAVDFVARLPYFDTPKAVTLLSYLRDKLPRPLARKLGVTPDRQEALFNAAEAIAEFDEKGQPVFRDIRERSGELDDQGLAALNRIYGSPAKLEVELADLETQRQAVITQRDREGLRPTDAAIERFKARRRAKAEAVRAEDRQLLNRVKAERDAALQAVRLMKMADARELDDPDAAAAFAQDLREAEIELKAARDRVAHIEGVAAGRIPLGPGLRGATLAQELAAIDGRQQIWRDFQGQLGELGEIRKTRRAMLSQYQRAVKARAPGRLRVTEAEARRRWAALTPAEQNVVRRFAADAQVAHRDHLSAHVNRELAKLEYQISSDIEAYVHHYGFLDEGAVTQFFGSDLRRRKLIAPAKRRRAGAEGFKRHLEGARLAGSIPLAMAQLHNEFAETFERLMLANPDPNLARPLRPQEAPAPGFQVTEENGRAIAYRTLAAGEEPPPGYKVQERPDGTRFASKLLDAEEKPPEGMTRVQGRFGDFRGRPYAIANPIYREFEFFTARPPAEPTTDVEANKLWRTWSTRLQKAVYYWSLNQLLSFGTYMRNLYSGAAQYWAAVSEALAHGDFHSAQKHLLALARSLAPKHVRTLPYTEFGSNGAQLATLEEAHGILRAVMTTALLPMGMIENLFKRALTLATRELEAERVADEMIRSKAITGAQRQATIARLYAEPTFDMRVAEEAARDAFAFNYNNLPLALRKMRRSVVGKALVPFPAYGYKLARFYGRYLGAAQRIARGKARRGDLAKLLAALVVFGPVAVLTWLGDEKGKARTVDPGAGVKYDFDRSGRVYLGLNDKGQEEWLLTQSYGPIGLAAALGHSAHDATTVELRNYLSTYYTTGPGFSIADQIRQTRNRYQAYRNNSAVLGDFARSWIPFHRPLESLTHMVDPTKRKQESFVEAITSAIPVSEPTLESVGLSRGEPRTAFGDRELVPAYDPWLEFLKEFGGINIKLIDPAQAQDEYERAAIRAQTKEARDAAKAERLRLLEEDRRQRQGEPEEP